MYCTYIAAQPEFRIQVELTQIWIQICTSRNKNQVQPLKKPGSDPRRIRIRATKLIRKNRF